MLQHEQTDPPAAPSLPLPVPNAAEARVTPDELNAALKALEDRQNSTVAIGSVVDELRLNATPEEIWAQVEKQRAEAAIKPHVQAVPVLQNAKIGRQVRRGWRHSRGWLWVLFWCSGGFGLIAGGSHLLHPAVVNSGQVITISGDSINAPVRVQGKDVVISGDDDKITLQGQARSVTVSGENVRLRGDAPKAYDLTGDGSDVQWKGEPHSQTLYRSSP